MKNNTVRYRKTKLLISIMYLVMQDFYKIILHFVGKKAPGKCVVIYYHNIQDFQRKQFSIQMKIIQRLAIPIRAEANVKLDDEKNYVVVTFDDGYQTIMENALSEIIRLKIPFTIFIPTKYLNSLPGWKSNGNGQKSDEVIMTAAQIQSYSWELATFGSHSHSHPVFTSLGFDEAVLEFSSSKQILEEICGKQVSTFSFPFGEFNNNLAELALNSGYKRIFTCRPEVHKSEFVKKVAGRFPVEPSDSELEFKLKILGAYVWLDKVFTLKKILNTWVIKFRQKMNESFRSNKLSPKLK